MLLLRLPTMRDLCQAEAALKMVSQDGLSIHMWLAKRMPMMFHVRKRFSPSLMFQECCYHHSPRPCSFISQIEDFTYSILP